MPRCPFAICRCGLRTPGMSTRLKSLASAIQVIESVRSPAESTYMSGAELRCPTFGVKKLGGIRTEGSNSAYTRTEGCIVSRLGRSVRCPSLTFK